MRSTRTLGTGENLTLRFSDLADCRPVSGEGGRVLRAFCPFHGGDSQRSLRLEQDSGRFICFACGSWGYTEEARSRWKDEQSARLPGSWKHQRKEKCTRPKAKSSPRKPTRKSYSKGPARNDLPRLLNEYQRALPGSLGQEYLRHRGISLEVARASRIGYAAPGSWAHRKRDWKWGRLVFPHTDPEGRLLNLYGRAVGADAKVPRSVRHDHLPGAKGYFNAEVIRKGSGPLFICEGPFDALSLKAAGHARAVAVFGARDWRWDWLREARNLALALDADLTGQKEWRNLARQACLRGKQVAVIGAEAYGGKKDINEAWVAGTLNVGPWPGQESEAEDVCPEEPTSGPSSWSSELARKAAQDWQQGELGVESGDEALEALRMFG